MEIQANNFDEKRKAAPGEKEYLQCLMLEAAEGNVAKIIFLGILLAMAVFPWLGIRGLVRAIWNMYDIRYLQFSIECMACIVLLGIGILGINFFIRAIKDYMNNTYKNTYKQDVIEGRFLVVNVEVIEFEWNIILDLIGSYVSTKITDCNGNVADRRFVTTEWDEIENTKKGLIVIFEHENGSEKVLYRLFPKYDETNSFCSKKRVKYEKIR